MRIAFTFVSFLSFLTFRFGHAADSPVSARPDFQSLQLTAKGVFTRAIEGPAVDKMNHLYVPNFGADGTIGIIRPKGSPEKWLELPQAGISSAIRFSAEGEMLVADRKNHRLLRIDPSTKKISILIEDSRMNQPNDFTVTKTGDLYLTDPSWSAKKKGSIWHLDKAGKLTRLATDLKAPNGIDLSPDEKTLYFSESIGGGIWSYDIKDGKIENKKLVHQFKADTVDGIRVDEEGAIYVARITMGKIERLSAAGKPLISIQTLGKEPTNLAFGGPDGKTVYVTLRDSGSIETFRVPVPGREWKLQR